MDFTVVQIMDAIGSLGITKYDYKRLSERIGRVDDLKPNANGNYSQIMVMSFLSDLESKGELGSDWRGRLGSKGLKGLLGRDGEMVVRAVEAIRDLDIGGEAADINEILRSGRGYSKSNVNRGF